MNDDLQITTLEKDGTSVTFEMVKGRRFVWQKDSQGRRGRLERRQALGQISRLTQEGWTVVSNNNEMAARIVAGALSR